MSIFFHQFIYSLSLFAFQISQSNIINQCIFYPSLHKTFC